MADKTVKVSVREASVAGRGQVIQQLREIDTDLYAPVVAIGGVEGGVTLTGDLVVDTLGALDDTPEIDPNAGSATIPALMRGELTQLIAAAASLATIAGTVTNIAKSYAVNVGVFYSGTVVNPAHEETLEAIGLQMADVVTATQRVANVVSSIAKSDSLQVGLFYGGSVVNPASEGTLNDIRTAIGRSDDSAGDPTMIGLLKQIMANTAG